MEIITHQMATIPWLEGHALALEIAWLTGGCLSLLASLGMVIFMVVQLDWRAKHSIIKNFSSLLLFQLAVSNALSALFYLISLWKAQSDGFHVNFQWDLECNCLWQDMDEEFICKLQAVIGTFPDLTSLLLVTSVHATLLIIVHKSRFFHRAKPLMKYLRWLMVCCTLISWVVPILFTITMIALHGIGYPDEHGSGWCWIKSAYDGYVVVLYYGAADLLFLANGVLFLVMWLKRKQMGFFRVGLLWYFPVYLLIYLPATIERFFDVFTHHPPFWMKMMSALTLPYQGFAFVAVFVILTLRERDGTKSRLTLVSDQYAPASMNVLGNRFMFYLEDEDQAAISAEDDQHLLSGTEITFVK